MYWHYLDVRCGDTVESLAPQNTAYGQSSDYPVGVPSSLLPARCHTPNLAQSIFKL